VGAKPLIRFLPHASSSNAGHCRSTGAQGKGSAHLETPELPEIPIFRIERADPMLKENGG